MKCRWIEKLEEKEGWYKNDLFALLRYKKCKEKGVLGEKIRTKGFMKRRLHVGRSKN